MKKLILILTLLLTSSIANARGKSPAQVTELKKILASKLSVAEANVETTLQQNAVDAEYQKIIDEITERIRRKKIDEAKAYVPSDAEILVELKARSGSQ